MPITVVYKMINEFGISKEQFFSNNYQTYEKDNELYTLIKNMSEESKESVLNIIKNMKTK